MTLNEQIARTSSVLTQLESVRQAGVSAILSKGGSIASDAGFSAFPSAISMIPSGGDSKENEIIERTISGEYVNNSASFIGSNAFQNCVSLTSVSFPMCTSIGYSAFAVCQALASVSFPMCTSIGVSAFVLCRALASVSFPVCTNIGSNAFQSCSALASVSFPVCTNIGNSAFQSCSALASVSFPVCTTIGNSAFLRCDHLISFYILGSSIPVLNNSNAFTSTPIAGYTTSTSGVYGSIIVQASMLEAFKTATNWSYFSNRFSVYNGTD